MVSPLMRCPDHCLGRNAAQEWTGYFLPSSGESYRAAHFGFVSNTRRDIVHLKAMTTQRNDMRTFWDQLPSGYWPTSWTGARLKRWRLKRPTGSCKPWISFLFLSFLVGDWNLVLEVARDGPNSERTTDGLEEKQQEKWSTKGTFYHAIIFIFPRHLWENLLTSALQTSRYYVVTVLPPPQTITTTSILDCNFPTVFSRILLVV